jgi:integrase
MRSFTADSVSALTCSSVPGKWFYLLGSSRIESYARLTIGVRWPVPAEILKREVTFLTPDEIQRYVAAIPVRTGPRSFDMKWLCFRALVEVLLGTGMRISEALSLKRSSINFQTGEATIIGKGNKGRVERPDTRRRNASSR